MEVVFLGMKKAIIILLYLLPILGVSQSLHAGLKAIPDLSEYRREVKCYKHSIKTQTTTECTAYIFSDVIVIRNSNSILEFSKVYPRVYRDPKGKLVEMDEDETYYYLRVSTQTLYLIKK